MRTLIAIFAVLIPSVALANEQGYFTKHKQVWCGGELGWHFYCDPERHPQENAEEPISPTTIPASAPPATSREQLDAISAELEERKAAAILNPTPDNIRAYVQYQHEQINLAHAFSDQWQRVLWATPELDYNIVAPQSTIGKRIWKDQRRQSERATLATLNERYGVFFFYLTGCVYCKAMSPALKEWSIKHGVTVQGVSLDGSLLPEWPDSITDYGQFTRLGLDTNIVPATVLFDSQEQEITPIAYGFVSMEELTDRIFRHINIPLGESYAIQ